VRRQCSLHPHSELLLEAFPSTQTLAVVGSATPILHISTILRREMNAEPQRGADCSLVRNSCPEAFERFLCPRLLVVSIFFGLFMYFIHERYTQLFTTCLNHILFTSKLIISQFIIYQPIDGYIDT